mmetsp:Transcript_24953/g.45998  ORF Transcript_24953/g.45998 Transcript_24953/m.45998 type:complete len:430 (-) Transcript_24953:271-1560(-)
MKLLTRKAVPTSIKWSADSKNNQPNSNKYGEKAAPVSKEKRGRSFLNRMLLTKGKKSSRNMHAIESGAAKTVKEEVKAAPKQETVEAANDDVVDAVIEEEATPMEEKVAPVKEEEVAPIKEEEVAPVKEEEVVTVKEEEVAPANEEEVAPMKEEEVDPVNEEEVAPMEEEEVAPAEEEEVASAKEDEVAPMKEEEVAPIEETSEEEATPFEETPVEKTTKEQLDSLYAESFEDITLETSIEAVEQHDAVVLGYYQPPVAPKEEQEKKSAFDEAVHNLQLMIDGAVVQTKTLGSQGMDLLTCCVSDVKDYAENNDLLSATPQEKACPKAQASTSVKPEAEESFIHPMVLEKFNDFVEQIKSKVEQPSSDDKSPELVTSGLGTTGFKKQTSVHVGDTATEEDVNNELALDEDNRNDCAEVNPALVNEEVRQ